MKTFPALFYDPDNDTGELVAKNAMIRHLFKLVATATYRWTDCDRKVYFDGNYWTQLNLDFSGFNLGLTGGIPGLSFDVPNVSRWFSNIARAEDLRNREFTIYRVALNRSLKVIGYTAESQIEPLFKGVVDSLPDITREIGKVEIVSHRITEKGEGPRRNHSPGCQWTFKDVATRILGTNGSTYTCKQDIINHAANRPITGAHYADYWTLAGSGGIAYVAGALSTSGTCRYAGAETWCDHTKGRCIALSNFDNFGGDEFITDMQGKQIYWGEREVKAWAK
jgi:hypothetical protein